MLLEAKTKLMGVCIKFSGKQVIFFWRLNECTNFLQRRAPRLLIFFQHFHKKVCRKVNETKVASENTFN